MHTNYEEWNLNVRKLNPSWLAVVLRVIMLTHILLKLARKCVKFSKDTVIASSINTAVRI